MDGQKELLDGIAALGKPWIGVLINGKPLVLPPSVDKAAALFEAFNPGMEGGTAIAEALFGKLNPSGKLTISIPVHVGQQPVFYNAVRGQHGDRYADLPQEPAFAFGFGLGYSPVAIGEPKLDRSSIKRGGKVVVETDVTNQGRFDAVEIVQLYVVDEVTSATWARKELKGYRRVTVAAGKTVTTRFELAADDLWIVDAEAYRGRTRPVPHPGRLVQPRPGPQRSCADRRIADTMAHAQTAEHLDAERSDGRAYPGLGYCPASPVAPTSGWVIRLSGLGCSCSRWERVFARGVHPSGAPYQERHRRRQPGGPANGARSAVSWLPTILTGAVIFGAAPVLLTAARLWPASLSGGLSPVGLAFALLAFTVTLLLLGLTAVSRLSLLLSSATAVALLAGSVTTLFASHAAVFPPFHQADFGPALLLLFWAIVGWEVIGGYANQVGNPDRSIPLAGVLSLVAVTVVYLAVAAALQTLPGQPTVTDLFQPLFGAAAPVVAGLLGGGLCQVAALMFTGAVTRHDGAAGP